MYPERFKNLGQIQKQTQAKLILSNQTRLPVLTPA